MQRNTINTNASENTDDQQLLERLLAKSQRSERRANEQRRKQRAELRWDLVDTESDCDYQHNARRRSA